VHNLTMGTTVSNLGMTDVAFPAPVFAGDTISTRTTVLSQRESRSRKDAGIVVFRHVATNQRGQIVARCDRSALMLKRPNPATA
jgi:acyl dehydratase